MLRAEIPIEAHIELILVVGLDGRANKVVGGAGKIWQRIVSQHLLRDRIDLAAGDGAVGVDLAGYRIGDGAAQDSLALVRGWDRAEARDAGEQAGALPVGEEKRLVLLNRTAKSQAVLVSAKLRPGPCLREIVAGVQIFVAKKL